MKNKRDFRGLFPSDLSLECKKQSPKPSLALEHPHSQTQVWFHMFTCSQCSVETLSHPGLISITVVAKAHGKDSGFHDLTDSAKHTEITEKCMYFFLSGIKYKSNHTSRIPPPSLLFLPPFHLPNADSLIPFPSTKFSNPFQWIQG